MAHSPMDQSAQGALGLTLAFSAGRATVSLSERPIGGGVYVDHLELALAEVDVPIDLDGGPEVFQHRSTRVIDLALRIDLAEATEWIRGRCQLPLDRLRLSGEGGHVALEGFWGPNRVVLCTALHPLRELDAAGLSVRWVQDPVLPMGRTSGSVASVFDGLVAPVLDALSGLGARVFEQVERTGVRSLRLDPATAVLWALFPRHGWKMPLLDRVALERIAIDERGVVLSYGGGSRRPESGPALHARDQEQSIPDETELLVGRGRIRDAVDLLLAGEGPRAAPIAILDRLLELTWSEPELESVRQGCADAAAARSPPSALGVLAHTVFDRNDASGWERVASALKVRGLRRAAGWALRQAAQAHRDPERQLQLLEDAVGLQPDDPDLLDQVVDRLAAAGRTQAALRATRRLVRVAPERAGRSWARAGTWALDDPHQARRFFEQALEVEPHEPQATEGLVRLDAEEGAWEAAEVRVAAFLTAGREPMATAHLLARWSQLLRGAGRFEPALQAATEGLAREPEDLEVWVAALEAARDASRPQAVARAFRDAPPRIEGGSTALLDRLLAAAVETFADDQEDLAAWTYDRLVSVEGLDPAVVAEAGSRLGRDTASLALAAVELRRAEGDVDGAMELLGRIAEGAPAEPGLRTLFARIVDSVDPSDVPRRVRLADLAAQLGVSRLETDLLVDLMAHRFQERARLAGRLGELLAAEGRRGEAARWLEEAVAGAHPAPSTLWAWADVLRSTGQAEREVQALVRASESVFDPRDQAEIRHRLAERLGQLGRDEEAQQAVRQALAVAPHSSSTRCLGVSIAVRMGDWDLAEQWGGPLIGHLETLAAPERLKLVSELGRAYAALGQGERQVELLEEALGVLEPDSSAAHRLRTQLADTLRLVGDRAALARLRRVQAEQTHTPERAVLLMEACRIAVELQAYDDAVEDVEKAYRAAEPAAELRRRVLDQMVHLLQVHAPCRERLSWAFVERLRFEPHGLRERWVLDRVDRWTEAGWVEGLESLIGSAIAEISGGVELTAKLGEVLERQDRLRDAAQAWDQASRRADRAGRPELASAHAARAAELFYRVGDVELGLHHDRAVVSLAQPGTLQVDQSLARLESYARETDGHSELVEWLERRAQLLPEDRWVTRFEQAQVLAHALGRLEDALAVLEAAEAEAPDEGAVWSERSELLRRLGRHQERVDRWMALADSAPTPRRKAQAHQAAAEIFWNDLNDRERALELLETAVRIDPHLEEARRLRWSRLSEAGDAGARGRALAMEARLASDNERAVRLWQQAGAAFEEALADGEPDLEILEEAVLAYQAALRIAPQDKKVAQARVRVRPGVDALEALGVVEKHAETPEERWACRTVRALFKTGLDEVPADTVTAIDRVLELLPRLDLARFVDVLRELGCPVARAELRAFLLDIGLEASAARGDWRQHAQWLVDRAEVTDDVNLRAELRLRAGHLFEWKVGDAAAAADEYRAAVALSPQHPEARATLQRFLTDENRFADLADQLGVDVLLQVWRNVEARDDRQALGVAEALAPRLETGSLEQSEVLLRLADLYRRYDDEGRANEVFALEQVVKDGPPSAQLAALERMESLFDDEARWDLKADVLRRQVELLDEEQARASALARLAETLHIHLADPDGAEPEYRSALALDPACAPARDGLIRLLVDQRRFEELLAELGPDDVEHVRRQLLDPIQPQPAWRVTEALAASVPERAGAVWLELADRLEGPRVVAAWSQAARAGSVEALDRLRSAFREATDDENRQGLAELLARLTSGAERADYLVTQARAAADGRGALLEEALAFAPDHDEARRLWILHQAEEGRYELIIDRFGRPALDALIEHGSPEMQEAALEVRAEALGSDPEAVPDWLRLSRLALARDDAELAWQHLGQAIRAGWTPEPDMVGELLQTPTHRPPSLEPALVGRVLDGMGDRVTGLAPDRWKTLVQGVLTAEGADGLMRVADGRPELQNALATAALAAIDELEPAARVEAWMALMRLSPASPQVSDWLESAFETAAQSAPHKLDAVATPWLEMWLAQPDLDAQRAAIERLRHVGSDPEAPEILFASLCNHLDRGRLEEALSEAEQLFDSELAQASLRRAAAERMLNSLRERSNADDLVVVARDRAWVELSRAETSAPEERRHALLQLADLRQGRGDDAAAVGPLEVALGLSGPEDQLEIRRRLRDLCEEAGDWAGAERHQSTIAEHSQDAEAWVALAELRMWLDDPRGVHAALSAAFRHDPRSPGAHMLRVRWAEQQQNWQEALDALVAWAQLDEDSVASRSQRWARAVEVAARHVPEEALPVARAGLRIFGDRHPEAEGYAVRVEALLEEADRDVFMVEALRRWPVSPESTARRVELARRLAESGQDESAHRVLRSGLQGALRADDPVLLPWIDGLSALPLESQFAALREVHDRVRGPGALRIALEMADRLGGDPDRMQEAEQALLLSMDSVAAAPELAARLQQRVDTWEGAGVVQLREAMLEQGVGLDPAGTLRERAHAFVREGRLEQAVALLEEARRAGPADDAELASELFRLLVVLERYGEADALFDEMPEPEPELVRRRGELVRERLHDSARGARLLAQAFRRSSDPALGRQATDALLEAQAPAEATDVARQVLELAGSEADRGQAELALAASLQAQGDPEGALDVIQLRPGSEAQLVMRAELLLEMGRVDDALEALGEMARDETSRSALDRQLTRLRLISEHGSQPMAIESVLERLSSLTVDDGLDAERAKETARILASMDLERAAQWARRAGLDALDRLQFEPDDDETFEAALAEAESRADELDLAALERLTQGAHRRGRYVEARRWGGLELQRSATWPAELSAVRARRWELQARSAFGDGDAEAGLARLRVARWLDPELDLARFREPLTSGPDSPEKGELLESLAAEARGESAQQLWSQAWRTWEAVGETDRALAAEAAAYAARPTGPVDDLAARLQAARRVESLRGILRAALGAETLPMSDRMVAARRLVELEEAEGKPSEALAVAQRGLSIRAPATDVALLEASARLAREAGLVPVELDALSRLARLSDPDRRQRLLLRQAVLLEESDPDRAIECLEEAQHPGRSALERLGRLLRRRRPSAEAELWARHATRVGGARKGAAFSRVANLRSAEGDRRGARAAWKAAVMACPDDLGFRRGLIEQLVALGERSEARREALDAYRKAHDLGRAEAAFSFLFEGLRLTGELGLHEAERSEWQEALELGVGRRLLLDAMVARARSPDEGADPEGLAQLLADAIALAPAGPERGELRLALARICQTPLERPDRVEALREAAEADFDGALPLEDEVEELGTADLGVSLGQLEVTRNLEARVAEGEARARAAEDPVLRSRVWTDVARFHLERREGGLEPAVRALNRAVQAHPMNVKALAELASLEMQQEDWGGARRTLARLQSLGGPSWTAAELELRGAKVSLATGDDEGAARWLSAAEARDPDSLPVWRGRLAVADAANRGAVLDGLLSRLEPELDGPEIDRVLLERAKVALSSGQTEVAQRAVEALQRRQPKLPGLATLRRKMLEAVRASEPERLQALYEESPHDPATLRSLYGAHVRSGDAAGAERVARELARLDDPDGLRLAADRFRAAGDARALVDILDRLGGPTQLPDPTAAEVAAWIEELGRIGRGGDILRMFAVAEEHGLVDSVLAELSPTEPGEARFWLQPRLELSRDQLGDPRIALGLAALNARFQDRVLIRGLADARSAHRAPDAAELYRSLLLDAPYDLQLLEGLARAAPPDRRSEVEAIRAYVRTGAGTVEGTAPGIDAWLWPRAAQLLGAEAVRACRGWWEAQAHRQRGVRSREAATFVQGPESTRIPVVRSEAGAFDVKVVLGSTPYVSVGWLGFGQADEAVLRFVASRAVARALLGGDARDHEDDVQAWFGADGGHLPWDGEAIVQVERLSDRWAMAQVRDVAVAVEATSRWGPLRLAEPPAEPAARTRVLSREPLVDLLRAMLTEGLD